MCFHRVVLVSALIVEFYSSGVLAQCVGADDCKDGQVCENATCVSSVPVPDSVAETSSPSAMQAELSALRQVEKALPESSHQRHFDRYIQWKYSGNFPATFFDFKLYKAEEQRKGAVGLITSGSILVFISIGLFIPTVALAVTGASDDWKDFFIPAISTMAVGLPLLISGIVLSAQSRRTISILKKLRERSEMARGSRFSISPWVALQSGSGGWVTSFAF